MKQFSYKQLYWRQ